MVTKNNTPIKWENGSPPEVGWWYATVYGTTDTLSFWNGSYWSAFAKESDSAEHAGKMANIKSFSENIRWSRYRPWAGAKKQ
jgi:hypothetical protein